MYFFELWHDDVENWYDNVRQLLENETESSCYKVIIKCNKRLLQSASGITKYLRYYKVWQKLMTKCVHYYIVRQVLQSMTVTHFYCKVRQSLQSLKVITEWDVTSFKTFRSASLFSIFFFFFVKLLSSTFSSNFMLSSREVLSTVFVHYYFGSFGL